MSEKKELAGLVVDRLTVESKEGRNQHGQTMWRCRCSCGNTCVVRGYMLTGGRTTSCGCKRAESMRKVALKHGMAGSRTYRIWQAMMRRCYDKNFIGYHDYGGRGITVDTRWHEFEGFFHDMGKCPSGLTLDRKDNNLGYSKDNCEWATRTRQTENRRTTIWLEYKGERRSVSDWARIVGKSSVMLRARIFSLGWTVERALETEPDQKRKPNVKRKMTDKDIARHRVHVETRTGRLVRPSHCQHPGCTNTKPQAHHHNGYSPEHQLDVVWVCPKHHPMPHEKTVEYNGEVLRLRELSERTGIPLQTLRGRLKKSGWVITENTLSPVKPWKK